MDEQLAKLLRTTKVGYAGLQLQVPLHLYLHKARDGTLSFYSTDQPFSQAAQRFAPISSTLATFIVPIETLQNPQFPKELL